MTDGKQLITMYITEWCGDCRRARRFLDAQHIPYQLINIDGDRQAEQYVRSVNAGNRSVPTIVFPDGTLLVEPSNQQLAGKLGIPLP